jgi:hypothetical protein
MEPKMNGEKATLKILPTSGPPVSGIAKGTVEFDDADRMFLQRAQRALSAAGVSALDLLNENAGMSIVELTKRLAERANLGVSAIGLTMVVCDEAAAKGVAREIALDLLVREIRATFPDGWTSGGNIHALVKLGTFSEIGKYAHDQRFAGYMQHIMRELTINNPPPQGWIPEAKNDRLVKELFDRCWPVGGEGQT